MKMVKARFNINQIYFLLDTEEEEEREALFCVNKYNTERKKKNMLPGYVLLLQLILWRDSNAGNFIWDFLKFYKQVNDGDITNIYFWI